MKVANKLWQSMRHSHYALGKVLRYAIAVIPNGIQESLASHDSITHRGCPSDHQSLAPVKRSLLELALVRLGEWWQKPQL